MLHIEQLQIVSHARRRLGVKNLLDRLRCIAEMEHPTR
jgi:hypothetical protein